MTDHTVSIDFETRSPTNIKLGLERYARDPQAEVLMLSYRHPSTGELFNSNRGPFLESPRPWSNPDGLEALHEHVHAGGLVRGWNVMFEWYIWNHVCVPKYGWPELKLEQCVDTMAQAAAMNLPQGLGRCAEVLGLDEQKNTRGKYLIQRLCVPHKPTKTRSGIWVEDEGLFEEFVGYCNQDVITEEAVARKLRPLPAFEQRVWQMTQRINLRGVPLAVEECRNIEGLVAAEKERLNKELNKLTGGEVPKATNRDKLLTWVNKTGLAIDFVDDVDDEEDRPGHEEQLANLKGATVDDVLKRIDLSTDIRRALEIRRAVCQTSTAKYTKMLDVVADDRTLKNLFVYHGAGTGRWASRGGLNVQNFARPILDGADLETAVENLGRLTTEQVLMLFGDQVMDAAVSSLRGMLCAPCGYEFLDADYSSVENRGAAWSSGQTDKVEMFAKGLDEYKVFAALMFKVPYEAVTKPQRQIAKSAVLGCMFGQGAIGLQIYARQFGLELSIFECKRLVRLYRREYRRVRDLWHACGDAMVEAILAPGVWVKAGEKFAFCCHKNFLWMRLPSGRLIAWAEPEIRTETLYWEKDEWEGDKIVSSENKVSVVEVVFVNSIETKTRQFCRHSLIGSSAFQSGVQGLARDILAEGALAVEEHDYPVVLMAHDELMSLVRQGWGSEEEFGQLMCQPTAWRMDLPLAFEAWRGRRFRK